MYETDPGLLLRELADRVVMVEINLTSNDVILGVTAPNHPLPQYLAAQVPVALSTDDEGVSRIDLTHEYTRAALEYSLTYRDLKEMARNSLEHAFLPGESLWQRSSHFAHPVAVCAGATPGLASPRGACLTFLATNPRAAQQWELEHRFQVFETTLPAPSPLHFEESPRYTQSRRGLERETMKTSLGVIAQLLLFLFVFFVFSLLDPFKLRWFVSHPTPITTRFFVPDGLLVMVAVYVVLLLVWMAGKRLRTAGLWTTVAFVLALALGLLAKFGSVSHDLY